MKITTKQAAQLLNTTQYSITRGLEYQTLDIGWYTKVKGNKRGHPHIVPERLALYLNISMEQLKERIENL